MFWCLFVCLFVFFFFIPLLFLCYFSAVFLLCFCYGYVSVASLLSVCRVSVVVVVVVVVLSVWLFVFGIILVLLLCCRESKQHAKRFVTVTMIDQIATKIIRVDKNSTTLQGNARNYSVFILDKTDYDPVRKNTTILQ